MLLIASLFLLVSSWTIFAFAKANLFWGSVPAEVVSSSVATETLSEGGVNYRPEVSYRYQVNEVTYLSDGFGIGLQHHATSTGSEDSAQDWVNEHPVGSKIVARYDKTSPQTSAIDLRPDAMVAILALFPVPHFCTGLAMTQGAYRSPELRLRRTGVLLKTVGFWGLFVAAAFTALRALNWITVAFFVAYFVILLAVALEYRKKVRN
jgi:hypothetical protein